ncbi:MAG: hypothetical protein EBX49_04455 [Synechococcaceae bacterium WB8_1B_136]|nr:hypothetical protein [Synechococcaceae bacterium WB8_1B_136]
MNRCRPVRPVIVSSPAANDASRWPQGSRAAAEALHQQLVISDRQWHALKGHPQRRAAEQLAAALVQLLDDANAANGRGSTPQRQQALALVRHALAWLEGELRDPGCPSHGR